MMIRNQDKVLTTILWLVAIHSVMVGLGLIFMPSDLMELLGFNVCTERFFPTQGGVFHIIMAIAYTMGATRLPKFECMISFSIIVKFCATLFLLIYYLVVAQTWMILFSGIADCLMGMAILWAYSISNKKIVKTSS